MSIWAGPLYPLVGCLGKAVSSRQTELVCSVVSGMGAPWSQPFTASRSQPVGRARAAKGRGKPFHSQPFTASRSQPARLQREAVDGGGGTEGRASASSTCSSARETRPSPSTSSWRKRAPQSTAESRGRVRGASASQCAEPSSRGERVNVPPPPGAAPSHKPAAHERAEGHRGTSEVSSWSMQAGGDMPSRVLEARLHAIKGPRGASRGVERVACHTGYPWVGSPRAA